MRAVCYTRYGGTEVLKLQELVKPNAKDDELVIKVHSSSVNSWDWDRLTGRPLLYRMISGLARPKYKVLGADVAGTIESAGRNVTEFSPGDEVYGDLSGGSWGGFAEYAMAKEDQLESKPKSMSFEQAAAIPQAGVMAVQCLLDIKNINKGDYVLINGGAGAVGTFFIQIAKHLGAHVTAVDSTEKQVFMRSLGANEVIDYMKQDFTCRANKYDLIADVVANRSISDYKRALKPAGVASLIGGRIPTILNAALFGTLPDKNRKSVRILAHEPNKYLNFLNKLFESGKVSPVIDKVYPLQQTAEALQYIGDGKVMGKLVIRLI